MKTSINIFNPSNGNAQVSLDYIKNVISDRRKFALNSTNSKAVRITVMTTNKDLQQVAAHYKSFEIANFNHDKAIEVYNTGGCQVATLIKK